MTTRMVVSKKACTDNGFTNAPLPTGHLGSIAQTDANDSHRLQTAHAVTGTANLSILVMASIVRWYSQTMSHISHPPLLSLLFKDHSGLPPTPCHFTHLVSQ